MKIKWSMTGIVSSYDDIPKGATITHIDGISTKRKAAMQRSRKFTDEEVREIRGIYNRREMSGRSIALRFKVNPRAIMAIIHRETYANV